MASLDMSLDDMIKNRRHSERGRGQGRPRRGRGLGGSFSGGRMIAAPRGPLRVNTRPSAYTIAKSFRRTKRLPWQRDLFEESLRAAGLPGLDNGTKLYVTNLDIGVTNEDIRELFSEIGELKRYAIHYDKNGRPSGSAEVVFSRRSDAFRALKRYNNVQLDGKLMKIEILGANSEIPVSARVNVVGGLNGRRRTVVMTPGMGRASGFADADRVFDQRSRGSTMNGRGGGRGGVRGGGRGRGGVRSGGRGRGGVRGSGRGGGHGGGRGRGMKRNVEKSAVELDRELENYHAESMQT